MALTFRYINKQVEPCYIGYSLILEDREAGNYKRLEQAFKVDPRLIDEEFLRLNALNQIDLFIQELNAPVVIEDQDGNINE